MKFEHIRVWALRIVWALLPFTAGPGLADALNSWHHVSRSVATFGLWGGWAVALVATLVPHPIGLTALRIASPVALGACALAQSAAGTAAAVAVVGLTFTPLTGIWCVNGPAYPNERRYPLRAPGWLLMGPLGLAWAMAVGAPSAGTLLLADGHWVAGGVVLFVGVPLAVVLVRALHGLSRRWVVFVPAGLVLHDHLAIDQPVLFMREMIDTFGPAPADTEALDLTVGAPGLALELSLFEKTPLTLAGRGRSKGESGSSALLMFTPTWPGAVLAEARTRRLRVSA